MRPLVPLALFLLSGLVVLDQTHLFFPYRLSPELSTLIGQKVILEGLLLESIQVGASGSKTVVNLEETGEGVPVHGKMILSFSFVPPWERGDRIRFETRPRRPPWYKNPGGFNYRHYLDRQGIQLSGFIDAPEKVTYLGREISGLSRLVWFDRARLSLSQTLKSNMPGREAGFLAALLVGDRSGLTDETWEDFRRTGTAHLLAISGQHIGILAGAFYFLFLWLLKRSERLMLTFSVRKIAGLLTLGPLVFYTLLSGSSPSAVRAAIGAGFLFSAPWFYREVDLYSVLAAAAILITLISPSAPFTASFQLSFLAVLGILFWRRTPPRDAKKDRYLERFFIGPLNMTLGASLLTAPLVGYLFHQISISGLLTNLWAIPAVGLLLLLGSFSLVFYSFFPLGGDPLLAFSALLSRWFLDAIHFSSRISWVIPLYPTLKDLVFSYLIIGLVLLWRRKPSHWKFSVSGSIVILFLWLIPLLLPQRELKVTFLDVGQGDSALVLTPAGGSLLIDGGGFLIPGRGPPPFDIGEEVLVPYLKQCGLKRIDRILLSHPHPDHYGGLLAVVRNFPVGEFWSNGQRFPDDSFDQLMHEISSRGIPQRILREGDRIDWSGLLMTVLYPPTIDPGKNINDNSLVMKIVWGKASLLFPGDIEEGGEKYLAERQALRSIVLKIPHHGSKTSSSVPFIDSVGPRYAVASLGEGNFFGFPHPGILEKYQRRGVTVYRTDQDGAITFTVPRDFPRRDISIQTVSFPE